MGLDRESLVFEKFPNQRASKTQIHDQPQILMLHVGEIRQNAAKIESNPYWRDNKGKAVEKN